MRGTGDRDKCEWRSSASLHSPRWTLPLCTGSSDARQGIRKKTTLSSLAQIPFPASEQRRQLMGYLLSVGCALWLVMCVCQPHASASHHPLYSHITYRKLLIPSDDSAVHPAQRYTYPRLIPDHFPSSFLSLAAPFLTPKCTQVVRGFLKGFLTAGWSFCREALAWMLGSCREGQGSQ